MALASNGIRSVTETLLQQILVHLQRYTPPVVELRNAHIPHENPVFTQSGEFSLTRQEFQDECDVNKILARYQTAGGMLPVATQEGHFYCDLTAVPTTLQDAMDTLMRGEAAFMSLPATVRREFDNDPIKFVEFASNADNLPRMQEWGLAPKPAAPAAPTEPSPAPAAVQPPPVKAAPAAA